MSKPKEQLRISGKSLGKLALPEFCPRCFWLEMHAKLPYQFFPGIFSSIDAYTKNVIHSWVDKHGNLPPWLASLGDIHEYRDPPHFSKFQALIEDYNILLTGMADGIYVRPDGSYVIVDYKTAKFTAAQDELLPIYEVQLNAYAVIGERTAFYPVSELALIYMEPVTQGDALWKHSHDNGFDLDFQANILMVDLNTSLLDPLFKVARDIYDLKKAPQGNEKCENCKQLSSLLKLL